MLRVAIVGAGISGITTAHLLLAQPDVEVEVFEAAAELGGRANVTADGEHCTRFFLDDYHHLLTLLREVPVDGISLLDRLVPARRLVPSRSGAWIEAGHMYAFLSREGVPLRDKIAISNANRRSLLVAKSVERERYAPIWNWSPPALLRALRASAGGSGQPLAFPGATDAQLIHPWVDHLRHRGATFHTATPVLSFAERTDGVDVTTPESIKRFDALVITAFAPDAYELFDRSGVARPVDRRNHTHCKCFTLNLDPREPLLADPDLRAYSWAGVTAVIQPAERRCIMLAAYAASSDTETILAQAVDHLPLAYPPVRMRVRDNLKPREAVFLGTYVQPTVIESALAGRVVVAGSYLANSYAVDSAEGACRTAINAVTRLSQSLPAISPPPKADPALPPTTLSQRVRPVSHPNAPRPGAYALWRLARTAARIATPLPARIQFVNLDEFSWDPAAPAVYVANHRSIFDVPAGILTFDRLGVFPRLVIAERYFSGATGLILHTLGAIPAVRGSNVTIAAAVAAVEAGESVAFMVEGRITPLEDADTALYGRGAFEVACRTGAPVIPIGGAGTHAVWSTEQAWPLVRRRRPVVAVAVGKPEFPAGDAQEGLAKRIRDILRLLETRAMSHAEGAT